MTERKTGTFKKVVNNTIVCILVAMIAILMFVVVQNRSNGTTPTLFGYQLYIVQSGSMEPVLNVGGVVIVKTVDPGTIKTGDIITFHGDVKSQSEIATHRVVAIKEGVQESFQTKGDANKITDPVAVTADRVIGKVVYHIPYAGFVLQYTKSHPQLPYLIMLPAFLLILWEALSFVFKRKGEAGKDHGF